MDRHCPMIKIAPETLTEPEGLDFTVTEPNDLGFCLYALAPKFWQWRMDLRKWRSVPRTRMQESTSTS
jgi:hypothetical protein